MLWQNVYNDPKNRNAVREAIMTRMGLTAIEQVFSAEATGAHLPTQEELDGYRVSATAACILLRDALDEDLVMERVLDKVAYAIAMSLDRARQEMSDYQFQEKELLAAQNGTEIPDIQLQNATAERLYRERSEAILEYLLDGAIAVYEDATGNMWRPTPKRPSFSNHGATTAASYSATTLNRLTAERQKTARHLPGTIIALSGGWKNGGQTVPDQLILEKLDKLHLAYPKMSLVLSDEPGAATLANKWAKERRIPHIIVRLDPKAGKSAAFKRNAAVLGAKPTVMLAFDGNGPAAALCESALKAGVKVLRVAAA